MTTPITVPSLRPTLHDEPFPGTEVPDLQGAIAEVQRWIDAGEVPLDDRRSRWIAWPDRPEFEPAYGPVSLNTGTAGIAWYSLAAADALGDEEYTARARRALEHVRSTWREHADDVFVGVAGTGNGHYGGLAGIGAVLIAAAERDPSYEVDARAVFDAILERRGDAGGRAAGWTGQNALLGDGGTIIGLLDAAAALGDERYLRAAAAAGELVLGDERVDTNGDSRWDGLDPVLLGLPAGTELDGFELGNVGIAFVLARLAVATGRDVFRDAAVRAAKAINRAATIVGDSAVLQRLGGTYSFGYCTGSAGVIRAFVQVYRATGERAHLESALSFGRGILRSGIPGRQTQSNVYVFHQCCGSAAILESFLGLWLETGDRLWLDAARAQADDLFIRSVTDASGRRWYSESHVLPTGTLKAEVGHQVGASGIALALLRLHTIAAAEAGESTRPLMRLPDDPFGTDAIPV